MDSSAGDHTGQLESFEQHILEPSALGRALVTVVTAVVIAEVSTALICIRPLNRYDFSTSSERKHFYAIFGVCFEFLQRVHPLLHAQIEILHKNRWREIQWHYVSITNTRTHSKLYALNCSTCCIVFFHHLFYSLNLETSVFVFLFFGGGFISFMSLVLSPSHSSDWV